MKVLRNYEKNPECPKKKIQKSRQNGKMSKKLTIWYFNRKNGQLFNLADLIKVKKGPCMAFIVEFLM